MTEKDVKSCFTIKKLISTSERRAEHLFAGRNTQHPTPTPNFLRSYFVVQKFGIGRETAYEIDPWLEILNLATLPCVINLSPHGSEFQMNFLHVTSVAFQQQFNLFMITHFTVLR